MARYRNRFSPIGAIIGIIGLFIYFSSQPSSNTNPNSVGILSIMDFSSPLLFMLLILWVSLCIYVIVTIIKNYRLSQSGILDIDKMSGEEFEERLMVLFRDLGYKVEHVGGIADAGVDLIAEKDGIKTAIQAKCYEGAVGESAIQQIHTGKDYYRCDDAIVITNSFFTNMASDVAKATNINLWNRNYLIKMLLEEKNQSAS